MASPPGSNATSPSAPKPLALPRQRPTLALPQITSRKPSTASATSTSHPLRQTSFPPPESLEAQHAQQLAALGAYSPSQASPHQSLDDFSDTEIQSAISGPVEEGPGPSRKRKRGEKRPRGRPARHTARTGSVSLINGEDGTPPSKRGGTAGARSVATADHASDEEDEDPDDDAVIGGRSLYESGQLDPSEQEKDRLHRSMFRNYMDNTVDKLPLTSSDRQGMISRDMAERFDSWHRSKIRASDLRRLINQTLSQSVPVNVVTVVSSYAKLFAGMLVEEAREVQAEWMAMETMRADGESNPAYKRLKRTYDSEETTNPDQHEQSAGEPSTQPNGNGIKPEPTSPPTQPDIATAMIDTPNPPNSSTDKETSTFPLHPGGAAGLITSIAECDRGPLLPDHLREALRRYKKARKGGTVGFTGLSLEGREVAASRMGGRRLFR